MGRLVIFLLLGPPLGLFGFRFPVYKHRDACSISARWCSTGDINGCRPCHDQCGKHSSAQHNAPALLVAYEQEPEEKLGQGALQGKKFNELLRLYRAASFASSHTVSYLGCSAPYTFLVTSYVAHAAAVTSNIHVLSLVDRCPFSATYSLDRRFRRFGRRSRIS